MVAIFVMRLHDSRNILPMHTLKQCRKTVTPQVLNMLWKRSVGGGGGWRIHTNNAIIMVWSTKCMISAIYVQ